ncbi:MAG: DNA-binding response regulator [Eubacterium sp.]|nr:DNA-binding response regulator [Eubacterium sp.]
MYKIMLVDDEPIVRLAIKSLINWEEKGFSIAFEASNGKQAMKYMENNPEIDIIITDINMPIMDGLELIAAIAKLEDKPEIIVLSAYNDYGWVRKAFKLGVKDYILKTEMEPEGILTLVNGMAEEIDKKRKTSPGYSSLENNFNTRYQKELFIKEMLETENLGGMENKEIASSLRLGGNKLVVCYIWIDDYQTIKDRYNNNSLKPFTQSVVNCIEQVLSDTNSGEVVCQTPEEYIVLLSFESCSGKEIRNSIMDILGRIKYSLKNYVNISASIGLSDLWGCDRNINKLYEQARQNVKLRFVLGKGKIIFPETAENVMWDGRENMSGNNRHYKKESVFGREAGFLEALGAANDEITFSELDKLLDIIKLNNSSKIEKIYTSYMELIFITISYLNKTGRETEEIFGSEIDFYEKIMRFETRQEIDIWIRNIISWILNYLKECKTSKQNRVIVNARNFIMANYFNPDLSLGMVSKFVELSESHFSTTFTKEVGETFTDYLTKLRLEKAKELITTTNMKLYEVCERVGYTNAEHFSRIFKKTVGCSPKDYKRDS